MPSSVFSIKPIGHIITPFRQKFAIPRQPNLAQAHGEIHFTDDLATTAFKGLDGFSHLWLLFMFHETLSRGWKPLVKAPRLGGNATLGVLASRSTHRPNGIGMSVVANNGLTLHEGKPILKVAGVDLLCNTPIIDIKPYIPYADCVPEAHDSLDKYHPIPQREVVFSTQATQQLSQANPPYPADFATLTQSILAQDPRPAYRHALDDDPKVYKVRLYNADISWQVQRGIVQISHISRWAE